MTHDKSSLRCLGGLLRLPSFVILQDFIVPSNVFIGAPVRQIITPTSKDVHNLNGETSHMPFILVPRLGPESAAAYPRSVHLSPEAIGPVEIVTFLDQVRIWIFVQGRLFTGLFPSFVGRVNAIPLNIKIFAGANVVPCVKSITPIVISILILFFLFLNLPKNTFHFLNIWIVTRNRNFRICHRKGNKNGR